MRRKTWLDLICGSLILLFLYTAFSKWISFHSFQQVLSLSPLIGKRGTWLAPSLLVVECLVSTLLFFPVSRLAGLYTSATLLLLFTGYIGWMLRYSPHLPCSCGGIIQQMSWRQHFLFNLFFFLLSLTGIRLCKQSPKRIHPHIPFPSREDVV